MNKFKNAHSVPKIAALVVLGVLVALYEFLIITAEPACSLPALLVFLAIGLVAASLIAKGIQHVNKNTEDNAGKKTYKKNKH